MSVKSVLKMIASLCSSCLESVPEKQNPEFISVSKISDHAPEMIIPELAPAPEPTPESVLECQPSLEFTKSQRSI